MFPMNARLRTIADAAVVSEVRTHTSTMAADLSPVESQSNSKGLEVCPCFVKHMMLDGLMNYCMHLSKVEVWLHAQRARNEILPSDTNIMHPV